MAFIRVLADGCFDPFHYGHLLHFRAAALLGDKLIVAVTHDEYVNKGPRRPVFNHKHRADVIAALRMVDGVLVVKNSLEALQKIRPDIFVKGSEYRGKLAQEDVDYCHEEGIRIEFTHTPIYSSTEILHHYDRLQRS